MSINRPNVLLICADHWAAEFLGVAGHPTILTPGVNEMAQCGVRFTNAYSESPVCIPARRTLMTGQTPRSHGDRIFNDELTMPAVTTLAQAFRHPHPPLVPTQSYLELYRNIEIEQAYVGDWIKDPDQMPFALSAAMQRMNLYTAEQFKEGKRAFYALCTQIDHQLRYLIGTLRLEGLLDNTIICFTSDHGDMLGSHNMVAKRLFYESSANVPMIFPGTADSRKLPEGTTSNRLVGLQDVMPTLLDLCDIPIPESVDGISKVGEKTRDHLYGEIGEDDQASRMIRTERHKLIYYPVGNVFQLFDLEEDPQERCNLAEDTGNKHILDELTALLLPELYGSDEAWIDNGKLKGFADKPYHWAPHRSLNSQRSDGWPTSPKVDIPQVERAREREASGEKP